MFLLSAARDIPFIPEYAANAANIIIMIPGIIPEYLSTIGRLRQPVSILVATRVNIALRIELSWDSPKVRWDQVLDRTICVPNSWDTVLDKLFPAR